MSKTIDVCENVSLTKFWGGDEEGQMVQITAPGECSLSYVQLTPEEMDRLLNCWLKFKKEFGRNKNKDKNDYVKT